MSRSRRATACTVALPLSPLEPNAEGVVAGLSSDDPAVRDCAIRQAAKLLRPEALVELLVEGSSPTLRASAMAALLVCGTAAGEALAAGARCCDMQVARLCMQLLASIPAPEGVPVARELLGHPNPMLALVAAKILGVRRDRASVPALLEAARGHHWVAISAIFALERIGDVAAAEPLRKLAALDPRLREPAMRAAEVIERRAALRG